LRVDPVLQQELGEAVAHATRKFKEKYPEKSNEWTTRKLYDVTRKVVDKVKNDMSFDVKKQLPNANLRQTLQFLEQVRIHYEIREDDPEMSQQKLWYLSTSVMDAAMKVKWLERWNKLASLRKAMRFPKSKFPNHVFLEWLHKATWWVQVPSCAFSCFP